MWSGIPVPSVCVSRFCVQGSLSSKKHKKNRHEPDESKPRSRRCAGDGKRHHGTRLLKQEGPCCAASPLVYSDLLVSRGHVMQTSRHRMHTPIDNRYATCLSAYQSHPPTVNSCGRLYAGTRRGPRSRTPARFMIEAWRRVHDKTPRAWQRATSRVPTRRFRSQTNVYPHSGGARLASM